MAFESIGKKVTELIDDLSDVIETDLATNFQTLYDAVLPLWTAGMMTYFMVQVYQLLYSHEDINMNLFIKNIIVMCLIFAFLGGSGLYLQNVVPFVMNAGDELGAALTGQSASSLVESILTSTGNTLTKIWDEVWEGGVFEKIGFAVVAAIQSLFIIVGGLALGIYALAYVIITKMMIGLILTLGGVFIMLGAIPMFRSMFTNWISACMNYIFLSIAFSVSFSMIMAVINKLIDLDNLGLDFLSLIVLVAFYVVAILMLQQVTVLVSSLTGGVGINGLTSAVNSGFGMGNAARRGLFGKRPDQATKSSRAVSAAKGVGKGLSAAKNFFVNRIKG